MIVVNDRIVIPKLLQKAVLQDLLHMHQGSTHLNPFFLLKKIITIFLKTSLSAW